MLASCVKDNPKHTSADIDSKLKKFNVAISSSTEIGPGVVVANLSNGNTVVLDLNNNHLIVPKGPSVDVLSLDSGESRIDAINRPVIKAALTKLTDYVEAKSSSEKYVVYVYTDPACGICSKMIANIPAYMDAGITLRFVGVPIFGDDSRESLEKLYSSPPELRMTILQGGNYFGLSITPEGQEIVRLHSQVASEIGANRTPLLYTADGAAFIGYIQPVQLIEMLAASKLHQK